MKYMKKIIALLIVSTFLNVNHVNAADVAYCISVRLPALSGVTTASTKTKKDQSVQRVKQESSKDLLSGDDRQTKVKIRATDDYDVETPYFKLTTGKTVSIDTGDDSFYFCTLPGKYDLRIKATKSTISKVDWVGVWYYGQV